MSQYRIVDRATYLVWLPLVLAFTAGAVVATVRAPWEFALVAWVTWAAVVLITARRMQGRITAARSITCYLFGTMPLRLLGACELRWTQHHQAWLVMKLLWQEQHIAWARKNGFDVDGVARAYDKAALTFVDHPFNVTGVGLVNGVCDGGRITVVWPAGAQLGESALAHEVSHLLQSQARGYVSELEEHNTMDEIAQVAA
jgi:hypothetical protein